MDILGLLEQYRDVFLVLHIISTSIAVGTATIHDISFNQQIKFFYSDKWNNRFFKLFRNLIYTAIFWLILSGNALFWPLKEQLLESPVFVLKILITGFVALVSFILYQFVMPHVPNSLKYSSKQKLGGKNVVRKLAFSLSAVSLTSWYSLATLGIVKNLEASFTVLASVFVAFVVLSIILGLIAEHQFSKRFEKQSAETIKALANSLLKDISGRITNFGKS